MNIDVYGKRQPANGKRQPAYGKHQPAYGKRQPAYGKRQPFSFIDFLHDAQNPVSSRSGLPPFASRR